MKQAKCVETGKKGKLPYSKKWIRTRKNIKRRILRDGF